MAAAQVALAAVALPALLLALLLAALALLHMALGALPHKVGPVALEVAACSAVQPQLAF